MSPDLGYRLKKVKYPSPIDRDQYVERMIVMQSENGPCPLIAIANVLSLRGDLENLLPFSDDFVSNERLLSIIMEKLLECGENNRKAFSPTTKDDYERNVSDAVQLFPLLSEGLDMNILFQDVRGFEVTPALILFDLLRIHLYHGWLPDPSMAVYKHLHDLSYNSAMDILVNRQDSNKGKGKEDGPDQDQDKQVQISQNDLRADLIKDFFDQFPSQLTPAGLASVKDGMDPGSLAILFRNNHFSVLCRDITDGGPIFQLATDIGFLEMAEIVWETLEDINGSKSTFVDHRMHRKTNQSNHNTDDEERIIENVVKLSIQETHSPEPFKGNSDIFHETRPKSGSSSKSCCIS